MKFVRETEEFERKIPSVEKFIGNFSKAMQIVFAFVRGGEPLRNRWDEEENPVERWNSSRLIQFFNAIMQMKNFFLLSCLFIGAFKRKV